MAHFWTNEGIEWIHRSQAYMYMSPSQGRTKFRSSICHLRREHLLPTGEVAVYSPPSILNIHPTRDVLYAAIRATGDIISFKVDRNTGQLDLVNTNVTGLEDPAYLEIDKTGDYLITPYYAPRQGNGLSFAGRRDT